MINFSHGGPITYKRDHCLGCNPTATNAEIVKETQGNSDLQSHNVSRHVPLDAWFHPVKESHQKTAIACKEVAGVYPIGAGNEIWLTQVPPNKFVTHAYILPAMRETVYGQADTSNAGFTFDVVAQAFDTAGAPVGAAVTLFPAVVASTFVEKGIVVLPAVGGLDTGANYLMVGIKPLTNPTSNPLSMTKGGFRLTVHALGS